METPTEDGKAPGVEPVFPETDRAINYAQGRACSRSGEIRVWMRPGQGRTHDCVQRGGWEPRSSLAWFKH